METGLKLSKLMRTTWSRAKDLRMLLDWKLNTSYNLLERITLKLWLNIFAQAFGSRWCFKLTMPEVTPSFWPRTKANNMIRLVLYVRLWFRLHETATAGRESCTNVVVCAAWVIHTVKHEDEDDWTKKQTWHQWCWYTVKSSSRN